MSYSREKVGRGNRKIVRDHFRKFGLTFQFGRDCVNNRYSFKPTSGYVAFNRDQLNEALNQRFAEYIKLSLAARSCPVEVDIVQTNRHNTYCNAPQYSNAVRFKDI